MFLSKHMCWNPPEAYKHHFFRGQGCRCSCCGNIQRGYKSQRCCTGFLLVFFFCTRQNCPLGLALNLWPSGDACCLSHRRHLSVRARHKAPSPSVSFIESADVPRSIASATVTCLSVESDSRPSDASNLAHGISVCARTLPRQSARRRETDGIAAHRHRKHTREPPLPSEKPHGGTGSGALVTDFYSCQWTSRIQCNVFRPRLEGTGTAGKWAGSSGEMRRKQCTVQMSAHANLLRSSKGRSLFLFSTPATGLGNDDYMASLEGV